MKTWIKLVIGIAAAVVAAGSLVMLLSGGGFGVRNLDGRELKQWLRASDEEKIAAAKILSAGTEHIPVLVACIDKIASDPAARDRKVRDIASLCMMGVMYQKQNQSGDVPPKAN